MRIGVHPVIRKKTYLGRVSIRRRAVGGGRRLLSAVGVYSRVFDCRAKRPRVRSETRVGAQRVISAARVGRVSSVHGKKYKDRRRERTGPQLELRTRRARTGAGGDEHHGGDSSGATRDGARGFGGVAGRRGERTLVDTRDTRRLTHATARTLCLEGRRCRRRNTAVLTEKIKVVCRRLVL